MLQIAHDTEQLARKVAEATRKSYQESGASPPSLIAKLISKALTKKRPRTRYAAGKLAKPLIAARKWLGDRSFDKAVMSQL